MGVAHSRNVGEACAPIVPPPPPSTHPKFLRLCVLYTPSGAVNPGYREELITPLTLKQELSTISHKWFEIGTYFKVQPNTLKTIKQTSESNTEVCLMKLCKEWLEEERDATWSMVVHMLDSEKISEASLANSIKNKYCNSSQSPDGSPESLKRSWVCKLCCIMLRASCLMLETKEFRCYEARK